MLSKGDIDFGRTAKDYARYRAGFPISFFRRLLREGFLSKGNVVLDLGTGTGTIARGLALQGFEVTGLDPSQALLDAAARLDTEAGVRISYRLGRAEATGLAAQSFDIVIAGQCWHWFQQSATLAEARRLLRPDGRLIVAYFDWLADAGPVDAMYKLQKKYHPAWRSGDWPLGFYPHGPGELELEGWRSTQSFRYVEEVAYTHEAWRGRMRAYAGIGGSLPAGIVDAFDAEFAAVLAKQYPQEPMMIPHAVWAQMWEIDT